MNIKNACILVIDDDTDILTAVRLLLKTEAKEVVTEKNPENIRALLAKQAFDLILLDMNFTSSINTGNEGIFWLNKIKQLKPDVSVVMITAYGDIDLAVRCLKEGASDFVVKPWHNEKLISGIKDVLAKKGGNKSPATDEALLDGLPGSQLIGESEVMKEMFYKLKK